MIKVFVFTLLFAQTAWSMPERFEVWFLSVDQAAWLDQVLPGHKSYKKISQSNVQCQPMGEYCFDPQIGLYKKGEESKFDSVVGAEVIEDKEKYDFIEPAKSVERNMIECDGETTMFDVFCGKAKKIMKNNSPLEVWIDVSSTMKQVDFKGFSKPCSRELFLDGLNQTCPLNEKMKVYYFDEYRVEAGAFDRVCLSSGLNNMKRIRQNIEQSKAKNIIIITDIFEAEESFINWIEASGKGHIKGLDKPLYAADINKELSRVRKLCQ